MARLQILELPTEHHGDDTTTPWVLIVDQASKPEDWLAFQGNPERLGARAILIFEETVDIPANETPVDPDGYPLKIRVEGDFEQFREQVQREIAKAQVEATDALRRHLR